MRDTEPAADPRARIPIQVRGILWSLVVGTLVGSACALAFAPPRGARFEARLAWTGPEPAVRDWPRPAREGERVWLETTRSGRDLVVSAGSARDARELAREFAVRLAATAGELGAARARVRGTWLASLPGAPPEGLLRGGRCAAFLFARARWGRELAAGLPLLRPAEAPRAPRVPPQVEDAWLNVTWVVDDRDPGLLAEAVLEADRLDQAWFAERSAWPGWPLLERAEAWRRWQLSRAELIEPIAEQVLKQGPSAQRALIPDAVARQLPALDELVGDPWTGFTSLAQRPVRPLVRPIASAWLPPLLFGAGAGALTALVVLLIVVLARSLRSRVRVLGRERRIPDPADGAAPLHLVSGRTAPLVVGAALELAAHRIAMGERVLLVDGSSRLRLHEHLGRDAHLGLLECLAAGMPALRLVQYAGHPGLHLLAHGDTALPPVWSRLGRMLDELQPHFGRIVLALEPAAPLELGDALRGRAMEGWWATHGRGLPASASEAMGRLGIALYPLDLAALPEVTLEGLAGRVEQLRPHGVVLEPPPMPAPPEGEPASLGRPVLEPIVLDCDLQVLQRLRFLAWMRRVQVEERTPGPKAEA